MKFSLITPSYNQAVFIERTIMSVLNQEGDFEIEYIVIDGWSTDGTVEILQDIQQRLHDKDITPQCNKISFHWISEKDDGQTDAINKGLQRATGDILAYINSDDTYNQDALATVQETFTQNPDIQRVFGKAHIIDEHDKTMRSRISHYKQLLSRRQSYPLFLFQNYIPQMSVFWRKNITEERGLFDKNLHLCMDYDYRCRIYQHHKPLYIPSYLANFRLYNTSKSWSLYHKQFKEQYQVAQKHAKGKYPISLALHKISSHLIIMAYRFLDSINK